MSGVGWGSGEVGTLRLVTVSCLYAVRDIGHREYRYTKTAKANPQISPWKALILTATSLPPMLHLGLWLKCYLIRTASRLDKRIPPLQTCPFPRSKKPVGQGDAGMRPPKAPAPHSFLDHVTAPASLGLTAPIAPASGDCLSFSRSLPTLLRIQRVAICRRCGWASGVRTGMCGTELEHRVVGRLRVRDQLPPKPPHPNAH